MLRNFHHHHSRKHNERENSQSCRVLVMGDAKVGKTEFIRRLLLDVKNARLDNKHQQRHSFQEPYEPTVEDFYQLGFDYRSISLSLDIVDTSGTEQFPAMRKLNIEKSGLIIIMYEARRQTTVTEAIRLYKFAREIKPRQMIIFLSGKSDLTTDEEQIESSDIFYKISQISSDVLVRYITCSAKTGQNIRQVFEMGLEKMIQQIEKEKF